MTSGWNRIIFSSKHQVLGCQLAESKLSPQDKQYFQLLTYKGDAKKQHCWGIHLVNEHNINFIFERASMLYSSSNQPLHYPECLCLFCCLSKKISLSMTIMNGWVRCCLHLQRYVVFYSYFEPKDNKHFLMCLNCAVMVWVIKSFELSPHQSLSEITKKSHDICPLYCFISNNLNRKKDIKFYLFLSDK